MGAEVIDIQNRGTRKVSIEKVDIQNRGTRKVSIEKVEKHEALPFVNRLFYLSIQYARFNITTTRLPTA